MDADPLPSISPLPAIILLTTKAIEFHDPTSWVGWSSIVFIAFLCLIGSAFVSGSEIAYFSLSRQDLESLEESQSPASRRVLMMLQQSERLLATILIANNLVNITMVVLLSYAFTEVITVHNGALDFLLQTVLLTFLMLVFGEIFPKLLARSRTMRWVLTSSGGLGFLFKILSPFARFMARSSVLVNKVVTKKRNVLSAEELGEALRISDIKEGDEKEMLEDILSFGEKEASDVMISRVDVTAIEYHDSWSHAMQVILDSGFSRIPVYDTSQDTIRGILYSKDLLPYIGKQSDTFRWQNLLREPYFVPETRRIDDLLEDFRTKKTHIAIVVDEYGGTKGIVTLEDVIEEIVGEIDDEYDEKTSLYRKTGDNTYIFEAKIPLGDFCDILDISEESLGDTGEAETLAGLLLEIKGDFPEQGEVLKRNDLQFQVMRMERHRILKVKVKILRKQSATPS